LASAGAQDPDVVVTVTRSAGLAGPGLWVLVNDDPAWTGATDRPAAADTALRSAAAYSVGVVLHELSPAADGPGAAPPPTPGPRPPPQQP
jgi:hypothetical protein